MTTIPKALAMANTKHVTACVATVAGLISNKFAIEAKGNTEDDICMNKWLGQSGVFTLEEEMCVEAYIDCEGPIDECDAEYEKCLQ